MGQRRPSLSDVLTLQQYRDLLKTAAKIKDKEESITIFFLLTMLGRVGLRTGEVVHMTKDWFKPDRQVITVPPHTNCDCGLCRHYAQRLADDNKDITFDEAIDKYWKPKDESSGDVPVETDREVKIINCYFDEVPYTKISDSTVRRRLKKIGELTDGVDGERMHGSMLRATSATHYAWAGAKPPTLDIKFRWQDEKTKEKYCKKTAKWAMEDLSSLRSSDPSQTFEFRNNPPTYSELRPEDENELIEVDTWEPDCTVPNHPRHRDDEEWMQEELEEFIHDQDDDRGQTSIPVSVGILSGVYPTILITWIIERIGDRIGRSLGSLLPVSPFDWAEGNRNRKFVLTAGISLIVFSQLVYEFVKKSIYIDLISLEVSGVYHMLLFMYMTIIIMMIYIPLNAEEPQKNRPVLPF